MRRRNLLQDARATASVYLPVVVMALMALGSWWLVRSAPDFATPAQGKSVRHEADYFMHDFSVKRFGLNGALNEEIFGATMKHFPDTDTLEIDTPRMRTFDKAGRLVTATAMQAVARGDGSEIELFKQAHVVRTPLASRAEPKLEFFGEYLHVFVNDDRLMSNKPVRLLRGTDAFVGNRLAYDNQTGVMELSGNVNGRLLPRGN